MILGRRSGRRWRQRRHWRGSQSRCSGWAWARRILYSWREGWHDAGGHRRCDNRLFRLFLCNRPGLAGQGSRGGMLCGSFDGGWRKAQRDADDERGENKQHDADK